ncbi:MAG TPA: hypothetical protein VKB69_09985 [Micromonosporaceae bacterium]|nr:hypothetical protein [Micromonosporaceae bacterium]
MTHPSGDHYEVRIGGSVGGDVQVGQHNQIVKAAAPAGVSADDLAAFRAAIDEVKTQLANPAAALAPAEKVEATAQLDALHTAATSAKPDLDTMQRVRNWFVNHLPAFAGAVTGLFIHPVVGVVVKSAGDAVTAEFRRRFGLEPGGE